MRKIMIFAAFAALLSLSSCSKVEPKSSAAEPASVSGSPVFTAGINPGTKTTVEAQYGTVSWEMTDEITITDAAKQSAVYGISKIDESTGYATFEYKEGATLGSGPYSAVYGEEPETSQEYSATPGKLYMEAPETETTSLTFTVQCALMEINLTKAGESVKSIAVTGTPTKKGEETTYTLTCTEPVSIAEKKSFYIALPEGTYTSILITDSKENVCNLTVKAKGIPVIANQIIPATFSAGDLDFIAVPEAVDLGLPSGLKWASFNLGATKPEEYGGYYQWAGLQDVTSTSIKLDWDNCPYHTGSSFDTDWTKYTSDKASYSDIGNPDGKTALESGDDVAHVKLGDSWRMPTEDEFQELIDNCNPEWTTYEGVNGYKFTSRKNSNSIFLPAAGSRYYDRLYSGGSCGYYWSSSLYTDDPCSAYSMGFFSEDVSMSFDNRFSGFSVRPVSE